VFTSDVEDENSYASIETWDDQASLDAHMQQPHTQALLAALPPGWPARQSSPRTRCPRSTDPGAPAPAHMPR